MRRIGLLGLLAGVLLSLGALWQAATVYAEYRQELREANHRLKSNSKILNTSFGQTEYATAGRGHPVLIVHGAGGGYDQGMLISDAWIGSGFRRIAISRFGYLRTSMPHEASHEAQADLYAEFLDSLGIEQVAIIAASAGGPSALQFALRHPDRCRAVVLVSATINVHSSMTLFQNLVFDMIFSSDLLYWYLITHFQKNLYQVFNIPHTIRKTLTPAHHDSISYFFHSIVPVSLRKPGTDNDRTDRALDFLIEQIASPVLVVHAQDDRIVSFANAEHAFQRIPGARLLALPTGGHLLIGQNDRVRKAILDFLKADQDETIAYD
jgi:pimeloyl-ACP methyl ester carboxylesterase